MCARARGFIARMIGRLTADAEEVVLVLKDKNFLLVLDGVDSLAAERVLLMGFKAFLEKMLEGVPGMSVVCTSNGAIGVPYENVIGITKLSDFELAGIVRDHGYSDFNTGMKVLQYMNGNPMIAHFCAALLLEGMDTQEIYDIISSHHAEDKKKLKIGMHAKRAL